MQLATFVLAYFSCAAHSRKIVGQQGHIDQATDAGWKETGQQSALASVLLKHSPVAGYSRVNTRATAPPKMLLNLGRSSKTPSFRDLPGVTEPLGFFDPLGTTDEISEGRKRFYREVELKHGRLAMLAAVGFLVAEQFHPLFGGDIDVPSYVALQETLKRLPVPASYIYSSIALQIAIPEIFSVFSFDSPFGGQPWSIREDHEPGNLGFDPLGLKPTDPKELKDMQTKELNNGRLAMLGAAGMIAQEMVTGEKLF